MLDVAEAAEVGEEALAGLRAYAGDVEELGVAVAHGAALAMIADGEAMALVADELDEMQDRRAAVEDDGLVFVAVDVDDFFALGDGGQGLDGEAEGFESFGGGVELAEAAVDEDERGRVVGSLDGFPSGAKAPIFRIAARLSHALQVRVASAGTRASRPRAPVGPGTRH